MPLAHPYTDAYLAPLVTTERETRAAAEVALTGSYPGAWTQRLVILRAYILTCLESQKSPDDTFAAKLSAYRKEYESALPAARAAQAAAEAAAGTAPTGAGSPFSVTLERA